MQGGGNSKKESKEMLYIKNHGAQKKNAFNRLIKRLYVALYVKQKSNRNLFSQAGH